MITVHENREIILDSIILTFLKCQMTEARLTCKYLFTISEFLKDLIDLDNINNVHSLCNNPIYTYSF